MKALTLTLLLLATPAEAIPFRDANGVVHDRDVVIRQPITAPRPVVVEPRPLPPLLTLPLPVPSVTEPIFAETPAGGLPSLAQEAPPLAPTPEPGTLLLLGTALAAGGAAWRRRRGR